jgi:hypothetical protein
MKCPTRLEKALAVFDRLTFVSKEHTAKWAERYIDAVMAGEYLDERCARLEVLCLLRSTIDGQDLFNLCQDILIRVAAANG